MTAIDAAAVREALAGDLTELRRGQENLGRDVHEILAALTGNGLGVSSGLIGDVKDLQAEQKSQQGRLVKIENLWQRVKWTVVGIAVGSGIGGGGIAVGLLRFLGD